MRWLAVPTGRDSPAATGGLNGESCLAGITRLHLLVGNRSGIVSHRFVEKFDQIRRFPASNDELQRRRRDIDRGLRRSHYAVLAASIMVGLFALAALWLSGEAGHRTEDARVAQQHAESNAEDARSASTRLWQFSARAARLQWLTRAPGQREKTLEIIAEASRVRPSRELRDEALSALLLPDVGSKLAWRNDASFELAAAYDANFEHFIQNNDRHRAIVCRAVDSAVLMDEEGLGDHAPFWQFSPDGRLAAIAFSGGQIGVWDWRQKKLMARFAAIDAEFGEPPFDFSPDGKDFWLLASPERLQCYMVETARPGTLIAPSHPARSVRLSPSGRLAALACSNILEIWDLPSGTRRSTLTLAHDIWRMAWQPSEERLAIGCGGGLYLWEIGSKSEIMLERGEIAITGVMFTADGSLLLAGGWNELGEIWDVRRRQRVLSGGFGRAWELSRDQKRIATIQERTGYGVREFLAPLGVLNWLSPPSLGESRYGADLDPQERWILTAHTQGWLLRHAESGKELARASCDLVGSASFSAGGSNVVAWTTEGLARWPLEVKRDGTVVVLSPRVFSEAVPRESNLSCFSADRRFTAYAIGDVITVFNTDDPSQRVRIPLHRPSDNAFYLSPDGRWLITGHHNHPGLDWYDTRAGQFIRTIEDQRCSGPTFEPRTGALFTSTATEYTQWKLDTGDPEKSVPWTAPASNQGFLGFAPDSRLALVKTTASSIQLYDLQAGRGFATLDFRDPLAVFGCHWSHDGQHIFLFGNDGSVTRVDLRALRLELDHLGLDWLDDHPSRDFPEAPAAAQNARSASAPVGAKAIPVALGPIQPVQLAWLVLAGLVVTIGIGLSILRYQRRLFDGYLETEDLAARRADELRQTQTALLLSEKMKALGTMAAGVAHDFNNLLSVVRLSSELIEEQTQPNGVTRGNFEAIQHAVQRGKGVVNSMLGYARDDGQVRTFMANELISEAVALLSKPFLSGLVLHIETEAATPPLAGRKGRLEQMLLNLIVNAAEAMNGRGTLRLGARPVGSAGPCLLPPREAPAYVELFVQDSGPGIPLEVLPRIFEPFFTTKNQGAQHGTGLGLSMLYSMAKEDGVGVALETGAQLGTTFRLLLPLAHDAVAGNTDSAAGRDSPVAGSLEIADRET